jgi:hypothetical protein
LILAVFFPFGRDTFYGAATKLYGGTFFLSILGINALEMKSEVKERKVITLFKGCTRFYINSKNIFSGGN